MLDALIPASLTTSLSEATAAANEGAQATATFTEAKAGRSAYVSAGDLNGNPDPGAVAVAGILQALRDVWPEGKWAS